MRVPPGLQYQRNLDAMELRRGGVTDGESCEARTPRQFSSEQFPQMQTIRQNNNKRVPVLQRERHRDWESIRRPR